MEEPAELSPATSGSRLPARASRNSFRPCWAPTRSLPTLKSFLVERASGNPFFVEEIVRALVDTGVLEGARGSYRLARPFSSTEVPPTVQAVLAARIDALPAAEKHLLQEAAVIGHDVPFALLHAICGLTEDELRASARQSAGCRISLCDTALS